MVQRLRATTGASTAVCSLTLRSSPSRRLPASARLERRALLEPGRLTVGANRLRDRLDVLQELLPGLLRALLVLLDPLDRVRARGLDVALMRPQGLRLQPQGGRPEDPSDGRVVEERVLEAEHGLALQQLRLARQVPGLLKDVGLGRGRGEELRQ